MKFKEGERVIVLRSHFSSDSAIGAVGTVTKVDGDADGLCNLVKFDITPENYGEPESWFYDDEIESYNGPAQTSPETTVVIASGRITFDALAVCAPIVVGDKRLDEVLREYADSGEDVEIVVRRKERG